MTPTRMRAVAALAAAAGLVLLPGCDDSSRQPAAAKADAGKADADRSRPAATPTSNVPKPDPARIAYDPASRTLTLYDLPDAAAKWMLHVPDQPKGVPVNAVHRFMDEIDPDRVAVFYTTPAGQASPRVSLREVLAARDALVRQ